VIEADDETLEELTEGQLKSYLHGAKILIKNHNKPRIKGIKKYFLCRDKSELDPANRKKNQSQFRSINWIYPSFILALLENQSKNSYSI
jgi:hypothetical protein